MGTAGLLAGPMLLNQHMHHVATRDHTKKFVGLILGNDRYAIILSFLKCFGRMFGTLVKMQYSLDGCGKVLGSHQPTDVSIEHHVAKKVVTDETEEYLIVVPLDQSNLRE
jgi:hypothetical protein